MMKNENYLAAMVHSVLRQSRVSVVRYLYIFVFEETAQAGNSHLMRLHILVAPNIRGSQAF